jgi:hypothetical protein
MLNRRMTKMLEYKTMSMCASSDYCQGWNDAVKEMPRWISVKDRMPEKEGKYIVCTAQSSVYCTKFKACGDTGMFKVDINTHITH